MSLALSAGAATWSQILRVAVTLGTYAVLRRFIPPEEMGVWNWAEALFLLIGQVRDLGMPAEVCRQREPQFGNYFLVLVAWSLTLAAVIFLTAPWIARAYTDGDPLLTVDVLRFLCLFLVIQGLGVLPTMHLDVEMLTLRTVPPELVRNAAFAASSIALAAHGFGVWSVIYAHVGAATLYTLGVWWASRKTLRLKRHPGLVKVLVLASLPLMVLSLLELSVLSVDVLIYGQRFTSDIVGNAGLATLAAYFVGRQLADATGRPLYPAMLRAGAARDSFAVYAAATLLFASVLAPAAFSLFLNAELVTQILGGADWSGAVDLIRWFAFVPLVRPLSLFGRELLLILRQDRLLLVYSATSLATITLLGLLLTRTSLGPFGMPVAGFFALGQFVLLYGIFRIDGAPIGQLLRRIGAVYAGNAAAFAPLLATAERLHPWALFLLSAAVSATTVAFVGWFYRDEGRRLLAIRRSEETA
ncbi:MAG: oligosaccharide flippase family protein [Acidobacteriota bacterium]